MSAVEEMVAKGEQSISGFLTRADELAAVIQTNFTATTLEEVHQAFAKMPVPAGEKGGVNTEVTKLYKLVREQAAVAVEEYRNAEMWLSMKAPSVSDGNNFGVDVQNFVMGELLAMRQKVQGMVEGLSTYHWQRGLGIEKIPGGKSTEASETQTTEDDGEKKTAKTSKSSTSKETTQAAIEDFTEYKVALDVKAYHSAYVQLSDIRNCYIKAHVLFNKNMKRLADPRGEGQDGEHGRNVMSMF